MLAQVIVWPARVSFRGLTISWEVGTAPTRDDPSRSKGLVTTAGETFSGLDGAGC